MLLTMGGTTSEATCRREGESHCYAARSNDVDVLSCVIMVRSLAQIEDERRDRLATNENDRIRGAGPVAVS